MVGGDTPLHYAALFRRKKIADLLRKHGGKTGEELQLEAKQNDHSQDLD